MDRRYNGDLAFVFLGGPIPPHNRFSIIHFIETQIDKKIENIPGVSCALSAEVKAGNCFGSPISTTVLSV